MNCNEQTNMLVHAYLDGELDAARSLEIEQHLEACPTCAETRDDVLKLRSMIASARLCEVAPARLTRRIRSSLTGVTRHRFAFVGGFRDRWIGLSSVAAAAAAIFAVFAILRPLDAKDQVVTEIVSNHVRSLMAEHLTDVGSSDQHSVKPWFIGKVDFSPKVVDLHAQGYPLAGGRLDYIGNRVAVALVYHYNKHVINMFIQPAADNARESKTLETSNRQGYSLAHWREGGMEYWAVTDAELGALMGFVKLQQQAH